MAARIARLENQVLQLLSLQTPPGAASRSASVPPGGSRYAGPFPYCTSCRRHHPNPCDIASDGAAGMANRNSRPLHGWLPLPSDSPIPVSASSTSGLSSCASPSTAEPFRPGQRTPAHPGPSVGFVPRTADVRSSGHPATPLPGLRSPYALATTKADLDTLHEEPPLDPRHPAVCACEAVHPDLMSAADSDAANEFLSQFEPYPDLTLESMLDDASAQFEVLHTCAIPALSDTHPAVHVHDKYPLPFKPPTTHHADPLHISVMATTHDNPLYATHEGMHSVVEDTQEHTSFAAHENPLFDSRGDITEPSEPLSNTLCSHLPSVNDQAATHTPAHLAHPLPTIADNSGARDDDDEPSSQAATSNTASAKVSIPLAAQFFSSLLEPLVDNHQASVMATTDKLCHQLQATPFPPAPGCHLTHMLPD